jgi:hypothetical protein
MANYRAYLIGSDGHIARAEPIPCDNDAQAIAAAKRLVGEHGIELWDGTRIVIKLNKADL